ncbi:MAG: aminomethyl-transferring glycine dehydrogenase [Ignavibacteriae bacterium]|nr:aminomethyl-transferring glycine dehydrogenase [Ignavibacteriota bacterium]
MSMHAFTEEEFQTRHLGPNESETMEMLEVIGAESLDALIDETIPANIRIRTPIQLPDPISEDRYLQRLNEMSKQNKVFKSYIGMGYSDCITPPVVLRNILENPGWYTQYTPYQAEISQGRLEALLNFQTMIIDLTKMDVSNASLLDEGTAAAEAMIMLRGIVGRNREQARKFFVSDTCLPQTIDVLRTRAYPLGIELVVGSHENTPLDPSFFGAILQYPSQDGGIHDYREFIKSAHDVGALVVVAADLLSLILLTPPGDFGADVVVGSSQRFGVPLGFGGPHAAYLATKSEFIRQMPGRIIGVSIDAGGNRAYRMMLQTREQHIRREKATSNICTAQALLAIMAGMYAVYHGPDGLTRIARNVRACTAALERGLKRLGYEQLNGIFFDTLKVKVRSTDKIHSLAEAARMNFRYIDAHHVGVSLDETTRPEDVLAILDVFAQAVNHQPNTDGMNELFGALNLDYQEPFARKSEFLTHPVFNTYHSETELLRYMKSLENRDLSLVHSMIPLGSCTMKLNATAELVPISWREFANIHPFVPANQINGYMEVFKDLEQYLCKITGLSAASLQPNSGAQGEYTGLMVIRAYHMDRGEGHRNVALIPSSAHGTNPASAVMAGCRAVVVKCDDKGNIDVDDLKARAQEHGKNLAALMVTYPSTHGVFEERIQEICAIVHMHGGQVYMDGANLNAQVGLTSPAIIGGDVCHINLHKTFSIPHGGGGPGMGPICVAKHLAPYLPGHPVTKTGGSKAIHAVASAPWGSASILVISHAYIAMLGASGVTAATKFAILNANYLKSRLESHYPVLYEGKTGRVAHEFILDTRPFKQLANVEVEDIGKRLMDYGFHAPTVSFPVPGTLMIEPTESESKSELDRFVDALIMIRKEIQEIADGQADANDNVLKNAPHTAQETTSDQWNHQYSRSKAAFPTPRLRFNKFWPPVGRINSSYGDRNIMCSCPPIESYTEQTTEAIG